MTAVDLEPIDITGAYQRHTGYFRKIVVPARLNADRLEVARVLERRSAIAELDHKALPRERLEPDVLYLLGCKQLPNTVRMTVIFQIAGLGLRLLSAVTE